MPWSVYYKNYTHNLPSPSFLLYEDLNNPFLCPVSRSCALAFADDAFTEIKIPTHTRALQKQSLNDTDPGQTHIRQNMLEIPILRSTSRAGLLSDGEILTTGANELIEAVTAAQRRQRMGHQNDDTIVYYISNTPGVDSHSIVLRREQTRTL